jgi:hypothetical protein
MLITERGDSHSRDATNRRDINNAGTPGIGTTVEPQQQKERRQQKIRQKQ